MNMVPTSSQKYIRAFLVVFAFCALIMTPHTTFAATCGTIANLEAAITVPFCFINVAMPILVAVEIIIFIYGIVRYLMAATSDTERQTGRKFALWGVIAIAVTVGVWGFIMLLRNSVGITTKTTGVQPLQFSEEVQNL